MGRLLPGVTSDEPINAIAVFVTLDRAHEALRGIDAADQGAPIPQKYLERVSHAIEAIETFCRERGMTLSEFARPYTSAPTKGE